MSAPTVNGTHVLYRFFDANDTLLYIGITNNPPARFRQHRGDKSWWDSVANIKIETRESRADLHLAERNAIVTESPKYNIAMNGTTVRPSKVASPRPKREKVGDGPVFGPNNPCSRCGKFGDPSRYRAYPHECGACQQLDREAREADLMGSAMTCKARTGVPGDPNFVDCCGKLFKFTGSWDCPECRARKESEDEYYRKVDAYHAFTQDERNSLDERCKNDGRFNSYEIGRKLALYARYRDQIEDAERDRAHARGAES